MAGFTLRLKCRFIRLGSLTRVHPRFCGGQFTVIRTSHTLLRLFVARFASLLFTLKSRLTRFKARFRFQRASGFKIDGAQFRFFLPVILHQRDVTRADIGAGTALNAVIDMVSARFVVIAALAEPVELLWQQLRRTGIGTG